MKVVMPSAITVHPLNNIGYYLHKIKIPKKTGGVRIIYAPQEPLKSLQKKALQELYARRIQIPGHITAYKRKCSAFTNANRHFGYKASIKFDLQSYFDSISRRKLWEALRCEGIYGQEAEYLSQLGTYRDYLYQGSCLSPFFANLVSKQYILPRLKAMCYPFRLPVYKLATPDFTISFIANMLPNKSIYNPIFTIDVFDISGDREKAYRLLGDWTTKMNVTSVSLLTELSSAQLIERANESWNASRQIDKDKNLHYGYTSASGHNQFNWLLAQGGKLTRHPLGRTVMTIYSDDVVISSNNVRLNMLKYEIEKAVKKTGFNINRKKGIVVMRSNPHVTGYSTSNRCNNAISARWSNITIDKEIRRPLHYMVTGKLPISEKTVRSLAGKVSHIKQCNPSHYAKYTQQLRELLSRFPELLKLLPKVN